MVRRRFRSLFGLEPERDVDAEMAFHIEMRTRELIDRGETPERARARARERFGDFAAERRACIAIDERRRRAIAWADYVGEVRQDVRYALRTLRRAPAFTAAALLTLILGLGAATAIVGIVHRVLIASLPFPDAERIYRLRMLRDDGTTSLTLSAPNFMSVRREARVFDRVEAYTTNVVPLLGIGEPREVRAARVTAGLFDLFGLALVLGRGFHVAEHEPGRSLVAVLDHGFWQRELGGRADAIGRVLTVGDRRYQVVGVLGRGARLPEDAPTGRLRSEADLYLPLAFDVSFDASTATRRSSSFLGAFARARPAVDAARVRQELQRVGAQLAAAFPESNARVGFDAISPKALMLGDVRQPLLLLLGAVAFLLVVTCANVANLVLARSSARRMEFAVRAALGAGRRRLQRQCLTEALVLCTLGGAGGLVVAFWTTRALAATEAVNLPRLREVGVDGATMLVLLLIVLATSAIFGTLAGRFQPPAGRWPASGVGGRGAGGVPGERFRSTIVVAELVLTVVLLAGAGLMGRSVVALVRVDPGFDADQGMTFRITMQGPEYDDPAALRGRVTELEDALRRLPNVAAVAATTVLPLSGISPIQAFGIIGAPAPPPGVVQEIGIASVSPDYFDAMGVPLRGGRSLNRRDGATAPLVAVVNEAAVRDWFADGDPVGRRVRIGGVREIVGVVGDVVQRRAGQRTAPQLFVPFAQRPARTVQVVLRARGGDPRALGPAVRAEVRRLSATMPVAQFVSLDELVTKSLIQPRFYSALLAVFAAVALTVAATGIFGVLSYAVAQRTGEIAVRRALGAQARDILLAVLGRSLVLTLLGIVGGVGATLALGRWIESQLFAVTVFDPLTLGVVVLVSTASAALATVWPAWRAIRVDPIGALRQG